MESISAVSIRSACGDPAAAPPQPMVLAFAEIGRDSVSVVGGKGANLGEMTRAGLPVPGGFVVTVDAYRRFLEEAGLAQPIQEILEGVSSDDLAVLETASARIQAMIRRAEVPARVRGALSDAYAALAKESGGAGDGALVAVRSSATAEDSARFSFAGMFQSFLNVRGLGPLLESVKGCWASAFGARVLFYRRRQGAEGDALIAVIVQRMVESEKSGVTFTANPATGDRSSMVIEGAFGLGEVVVLGEVTPDRYEVDKTTRQITARSVGDKRFMLVREPATGKNVRVALDAERARAPVLDDAEIGRLAELGARLEAHYGVPQDAEWAIAGGRAFLVQTRPITTLAASREEPPATDLAGMSGGAPGSGIATTAAVPPEGQLLVRGLSASPGRATGRVRVLASASGAGALQEGEVLVAPTTTPDWVPIMRRAAAIVTDAGGMTSHAAIVSRELGIPCVVGTRDGTRKLTDGTLVTVDGGSGQVTEGGAAATDSAEVAGAAATSGASPVQRARIPATAHSTSWDAAPVTATRLYVNLAEPARAQEIAVLPVDGVGLLRAEFMVLDALGGRHPRLLLEEGKGEEFVERMTEGLTTFARAFHPRPIVYRAMDFRSNEFRGLEGGDRFEPAEQNPMIGYRGCFRYTREPDLFALELSALARVRRDFPSLHLMLPFVRTGSELVECMRIIDGSALKGDRTLQRWVMAEVPSVLYWLEEYVRLGATGVSIGSNDLTQLMLGVDRDSEILAPLFDERDRAVLRAVEHIIRECRRLGVTCSICGQAPSVHPDYVERLVEWGIDSVSVSPDVVDVTRRNLAAAEQRLLLRAARGDRGTAIR